MKNFVYYLPLLVGWCIGQVIVCLLGCETITQAVTICVHVSLFALVASFVVRPSIDYNEFLQVAIRKVHETLEKEGLEVVDGNIVEKEKKE